MEIVWNLFKFLGMLAATLFLTVFVVAPIFAFIVHGVILVFRWI